MSVGSLVTRELIEGRNLPTPIQEPSLLCYDGMFPHYYARGAHKAPLEIEFSIPSPLNFNYMWWSPQGITRHRIFHPISA